MIHYKGNLHQVATYECVVENIVYNMCTRKKRPQEAVQSWKCRLGNLGQNFKILGVLREFKRGIAAGCGCSHL